MKNFQQLNPAPLVKKFFNQTESGEALDIGCGKGDNALFLAEKGFNVTAIDINNNLIKNLENQAEKIGIRINTAHSDMRNFYLQENRYSIIIAINSLFFLSQDEFIDAIKKIKNSVKPGGIIIITSFTVKDPMFDKMSKSHDFFKLNNNAFKNKQGNKWYFLELNELKTYFEDNFEVLLFNEEIAQDKGHNGTPEPHQHAIARIVVKKKTAS